MAPVKFDNKSKLTSKTSLKKRKPLTGLELLAEEF